MRKSTRALIVAILSPLTVGAFAAFADTVSKWPDTPLRTGVGFGLCALAVLLIAGHVALLVDAMEPS